MTLTEQQLRQMMPHAGTRLDAPLPYINPALAEAKIDTPQRIAAFMAQLAHESGEYRYMEEIADGSAYEGRTDLGNVQTGDGVRFKGHGPIQITGRANHAACGAALGIDAVANPKLLTLPEYGTRAAWLVLEWPQALTVRRPRLAPRHHQGDQRWLQRPGRAARVLDAQSHPVGLGYVDTDVERAAIMRFQSSRSLFADGIIGPRTLAALAA
jgi:hypothetical protein